MSGPFGKVFAQLWKGTLIGQPDEQLVFIYMVCNCSRDGLFDEMPEVIALHTGIPLERVLAAIKTLSAPDPRSRTPDAEGRRIVLSSDCRDWGWIIVNYEHYRSLRDSELRREQTREAMQRHRDKVRELKALTPANSEQGEPVKSTVSPSRGRGRSIEKKETPRLDWDPFEEVFWTRYPRKVGKDPARVKFDRHVRPLYAKAVGDEVPPEVVAFEAGLEAWCAYWSAHNTQLEYIPHPATFLNQGRWKDKPA